MPFRTRSTPAAFNVVPTRRSSPSVVSICEPAPAVTLPVKVRPAAAPAAPPLSVMVSAPVVVKAPRLSMRVLVAETLPALP